MSVKRGFKRASKQKTKPNTNKQKTKIKNPSAEQKRKQPRDLCSEKDWWRERAGNKVYPQLIPCDVHGGGMRVSFALA